MMPPPRGGLFVEEPMAPVVGALRFPRAVALRDRGWCVGQHQEGLWHTCRPSHTHNTHSHVHTHNRVKEEALPSQHQVHSASTHTGLRSWPGPFPRQEYGRRNRPQRASGKWRQALGEPPWPRLLLHSCCFPVTPTTPLAAGSSPLHLFSETDPIPDDPAACMCPVSHTKGPAA